MRRRLTLAMILMVCLLPNLWSAPEESLEVRASGGEYHLILNQDGQFRILHSSPLPILLPRLHQAPEGSALGVTWSEGRVGGSGAGWYLVSRDGQSFHGPEPVRHELHLRYAVFDPLREEPRIDPELRARPDHRLFVVQYHTQGLAAYRDHLQSLGHEVRFHVPDHADVVEMGRDEVDAVRNLSFVRQVVPFHPAFKLEEAFLAERAAGAAADIPTKVNLLTTQRGPDGHEALVRFLEQRGGEVRVSGDRSFLVEATLDRSLVMAASQRSDVQWIDRPGEREQDMDLARIFHGADYVEAAGGFRGNGVNAEVLDSGCDEGHPDLQNFIRHGGNSPSAHGTCTSGIVCGSGAGSANATGAMPDARLIIADYGFLGSRYNHTRDLADPTGPYRAVLQSNSWGNSRTKAYTSISQSMDLILFDFEKISICQSQSNAGTQNSRPQAWAKNIIAVGGIKHRNTLSESDDSWTRGASIGPAADKRIKPDVSSFYDSTNCTDQVGSAGYSSGNYYSSFGGTSGATPIVAGHLGLLYEMWSTGMFGNPTSGTDVFDNAPYNTTAKALLINTAAQWQFSGSTADLTRVHQGWGRPNLQDLYDLKDDFLIVDETDVLKETESTVYLVTLGAGTPALKITMVYRDFPGTTSSRKHRINNLNLRVKAPDGTVYWGNWGLLADLWSVPGGKRDRKNTVENVFIQNPMAGTWTIRIKAAEINQDAHVETPDMDTDYALVVSGV